MDFTVNKLFFKKHYDENNLFTVKSIHKIIIHVPKLLHKNSKCFTSKPNALAKNFKICILKLIKNQYSEH